MAHRRCRHQSRDRSASPQSRPKHGCRCCVAHVHSDAKMTALRDARTGLRTHGTARHADAPATTGPDCQVTTTADTRRIPHQDRKQVIQTCHWRATTLGRTDRQCSMPTHAAPCASAIWNARSHKSQMSSSACASRSSSRAAARRWQRRQTHIISLGRPISHRSRTQARARLSIKAKFEIEPARRRNRPVHSKTLIPHRFLPNFSPACHIGAGGLTPLHPPISAIHASSVSTSTPNSVAFFSFEPASAPATT